MTEYPLGERSNLDKFFAVGYNDNTKSMLSINIRKRYFMRKSEKLFCHYLFKEYNAILLGFPKKNAESVKEQYRQMIAQTDEGMLESE